MFFYKKAISGVVVMLAVFFLSPPVHGQTLYQMLERLVNEHDLIQAAQAGKEAAAQGVRRETGERYPHLAARANIGQEYIDPAGRGDSTSETRNYQGVRISQLLYDFGRARSGVDRAKAGLALSEAELAATRQDIILQGVAAYLAVYRHAERLRLAMQSEKRIVELTGIEESLVNRGAGMASDVLQAKSQLAGARAHRVRVEGQLINARNRFKTLFGVDLTDEAIEKMTRPEKPVAHMPRTLDKALAAANDNSLDLYIAGHNIEMARHELSFRKTRYYPGLHLVGEAKRRENDLGIRGTRNDALGMVELTWDIYSGGKERAAVSQARHSLSEIEKRRDDLSQAVRERVLVAWQDLQTSRENAYFLKDQADVLEKFLEMAKRERKLGNRSLLDVLNGEVTHLNALSNAVAADIDQDMAMYNMLYAMGMLELTVFR